VTLTDASGPEQPAAASLDPALAGRRPLAEPAARLGSAVCWAVASVDECRGRRPPAWRMHSVCQPRVALSPAEFEACRAPLDRTLATIRVHRAPRRRGREDILCVRKLNKDRLTRLDEPRRARCFEGPGPSVSGSGGLALATRGVPRKPPPPWCVTPTRLGACIEQVADRSAPARNGVRSTHTKMLAAAASRGLLRPSGAGTPTWLAQPPPASHRWLPPLRLTPSWRQGLMPMPRQAGGLRA